MTAYVRVLLLISLRVAILTTVLLLTDTTSSAHSTNLFGCYVTLSISTTWPIRLIEVTTLFNHVVLSPVLFVGQRLCRYRCGHS